MGRPDTGERQRQRVARRVAQDMPLIVMAAACALNVDVEVILVAVAAATRISIYVTDS